MLLFGAFYLETNKVLTVFEVEMSVLSVFSVQVILEKNEKPAFAKHENL